MKVFISSVIRGFEQFREAARNGVIQAGMLPVMAEDSELFHAQSLSPQTVCFQGIDSSEVFVLILGQRYGDLTEADISVVEEEYWHARLSEKEIKIFVHSGDKEPEQEQFLTRVSKWESGHFQNSFDSPEDLKLKIMQALSEVPKDREKQTRSPLREGIHDWLVCLKKYTEAQLDRSTMTTPIIGTEPRPEIEKLKSVLGKNRKALVTGESGTGKSGLLAMFIDGELIASKQPVLFLNANALPHTATSLDAVTDIMPVETPLAKMLKLVSEIMGVCYVVVDQLDSVGGTDLCRVLCAFLKEMSTLPEIKVVAASRSYDAKERNEIRTLDFPTVEVKLLPDEGAKQLLGKLGVPDPSQDLIKLSQNFLNLSIIGSLVESGVLVSDLTSEVTLWNRFRESVVERESPEALAKAVELAQSSMRAQEWDFALDIAPDDPTRRLISRGILVRSAGERYSFFHEEMRSYLYAWDASMRHKILPDAVCKELGEVEAFGVLRWIQMMYHEEMPEIESGFVRVLLEAGADFSFYTRAVCLDVLKKQRNPTPETAKILGNTLKSVEAHSRYFFDTLDNPVWLRILTDQGIFETPPEPIRKDKGVIMPRWEAANYLITVADICAAEVTEIATSIKTENVRVYEQLVQASLRMPACHAAKVACAARDWLAAGYQFFVLPELCGELSAHLAAGGEWESAFALCEALIETTVDPPPPSMKDNPYFRLTARFKHDKYAIERFVQERLPALGDLRSKEVLALLEKQLIQTAALDQSDPRSSFWRHAVEEHPQNLGHGECKDVLTGAIRDLLSNWSKSDATAVKPVLERYLDHECSIFRRMALYIIQIHRQPFAELAKQTLMNRALLYDVLVHHEYTHLLQTCFEILAPDEQRQLLNWILEGPKVHDEESEERRELRKSCWIRDRLYMIKEQLPQDARSKLELLTTRFGEPEHPDFLAYFTSWTGSASPLTKMQVEEMPDDQLVNFLKGFTPSGDTLREPSPEGLADVLQTAVFDDPARFAQLGPRLIDEEVKASYVYALLAGLEAAWKDGKSFEWEPVVALCESVVFWPHVPQGESSQPSSDEDSVKWPHIPGEVADLLREGMERDEHAIPPTYIPRIRKMLLRLVQDPHPTPDEEQEAISAGNWSPEILSLNCNRGKAMHALITYALRFARVKYAEKQGEEDPFPNGKRMEPEVQQVLDDKLAKTKDASLVAHSVFGWYLPNFLYLDRQWLEKSLPLIFPSKPEDEEYWKAAWGSYISHVGRVYTELYKLLRSQYRRAIADMAQVTLARQSVERPCERLAEHLIIAYLNDLEKLEDPGGLLGIFYQNAPDHIRGHAVWFLWRLLQDEKPAKNSNLWLKMRHLWERRIVAMSETDAPYEMREELSSFAWWLEDTPENLSGLYDLLEPLVPYLEVGTQGRHFLEYLAKQAKAFPIKAGQLLLKMTEDVPDNIYLSREEPVRQILESAIRSTEAEAKTIVYKIVNLFGERGDYRYKDLLGR